MVFSGVLKDLLFMFPLSTKVSCTYVIVLSIYKSWKWQHGMLGDKRFFWVLRGIDLPSNIKNQAQQQRQPPTTSNKKHKPNKSESAQKRRLFESSWISHPTFVRYFPRNLAGLASDASAPWYVLFAEPWNHRHRWVLWALSTGSDMQLWLCLLSG